MENRRGRLPSILRAQNNFNDVLDDIDVTDTDFVETFAERFHANRAGSSPPPCGRRHGHKKRPKRGRPARTYKMKIVAMSSPSAVRRPSSWKALKKLADAGLGHIQQDCEIPADLDAPAFQKFLWEKFPPLHGIPLIFKKAQVNGEFTDLKAGTTKTPQGIKDRKRCIYILPSREIPSSRMAQVTNSSATAKPCTTCGRTLDGTQCIVCEQNQAFKESLAADKRREEKIYEEQNMAAHLAEVRNRRKEALSAVEEPPNGFRLKCRLPTGLTMERKFNKEDSLMDLVNWIGATTDATEDFIINVLNHAPVKASIAGSKNLRDIGLESSCLINISWIEPELSHSMDLTSSPGSMDGGDPQNSIGSDVDHRMDLPGTSRAMDAEHAGLSSSVVTERSNSGTPGVQFPLMNLYDSDDDFEDTLPVMSPLLDQLSPLSALEDANDTEDVLEVAAISDSERPPEVLLVDDVMSDLKTELTLLQSRMSMDVAPLANYVNVTRDRVMECASRAFRRKAFDPLKKLSVLFVDAYDNSEGAVDNGGPTREFFRLLLKEALSSSVFEGPEDARQLSLSTQALTKGRYKLIGQSLALSLLHGGPGPMCLSQILYQRMSGQKASLQSSVTVDDINEDNVKELLNKISNANTVDEVRNEITENQDLLAVLGSIRHIRSLADRDALIDDTVQYYVFGRTQSALDQFMTGLETGGILASVTKNPDLFRHLFVKNEGSELNHDVIKKLFHFKLSENGSTRRILEDRVVTFWNDWLIDIEAGESKITFAKLLIFAAACDVIPPLGLTPTPTIEVNKDGGSLPTANTCALVMTLPVHSEYDDWKTKMEDGILGSPLFGKK